MTLIFSIFYKCLRHVSELPLTLFFFACLKMYAPTMKMVSIAKSQTFDLQSSEYATFIIYFVPIQYHDVDF